MDWEKIRAEEIIHNRWKRDYPLITKKQALECERLCVVEIKNSMVPNPSSEKEYTLTKYIKEQNIKRKRDLL